MRNWLRVAQFVITWLVIVPAMAYAQGSSITGVVKDTSAAVMPGVTVEASSPVLIEKTRSVVTDGTGQYKIVDLRPGTYTVTFTLPGFNTVKREGIELSGSFTATVNGELKVGAIEETLTVTSETPIVDVQNVRTQQTMNKALIEAIPATTQFYGLANLVPAVNFGNSPLGQDVGGSTGIVFPTVRAHGSLTSDYRLYLDGLSIGYGQMGMTMFLTSAALTQEQVVTISGGLAEAETAGSVVNIIPRDGGNKISGTVLASGTTKALQGSNLTPDLTARGFTAANSLWKVANLNPGIGGAFIKDKLWFFGTYQYNLSYNYIANMHPNLNAGDITKWTYVPDLSSQSYSDQVYNSGGVRLTLQATPRNKFTVYWEEQKQCWVCGTSGGTPVLAPEANFRQFAYPNRAQQATWSSPVTSRLLLEAGFGGMETRWGGHPRQDGTDNPLMISVTEQGGLIPGLTYRAPPNFTNTWQGTYSWRGSATYATGAHAFKVGYLGQFDPNISPIYRNQGLTYRFNNGVPNQLTEFASPVETRSNIKQTGLYAQDSWTRKRLTLQGGVRYDALNNIFPAQGVGPTPLFPTAIAFPETDGMGLKDITLRGGLAYDVFGNGKTAVKVSLGKYMSNEVGFNPLGRVALNTSRAWNDANHNFVPDCDLLNRAANGECGAIANQSYGTTTFSTTPDDNVINGWGNRQYQWEGSASVQQELMPRLSANVGFYRRSFGNQSVTDNLAVAASDYTKFNVTAPANAGLPNGGGQTVTVWDVNSAPGACGSPTGCFGLTNNAVRLASNYGGETQTWTGVDVSVNARLRNGLTLQGGTSTGQSVFDICKVAAQVPEAMNGLALFSTQVPGGGVGAPTAGVWTPLDYCHQASGFLTQVKGLASYSIPKIDVQISGTLQSAMGPSPVLLGNVVASSASVAGSLGRPLAGNAPNITVNVVPPGALVGARYNQVDLRFAKILKFGRTRTQIALDLFNAMNSSATQTYTQTVGPAYLNPTAIMPARLFKFSGVFNF